MTNENENLKDMIQGEFNRICVTDDMKEIDDMLVRAVYNIIDFCKQRRKEIRIKHINAMYGTSVISSNVKFTDPDNIYSSDVIYIDTDSVKTERVYTKQEVKHLVQEIADYVGGYTCTNSLELANDIIEKWGK